MEGFDEGTSQQSGIHPLQRIGNCYFRDKNTIYYFWNASLQQINKLRIHLFFLFLNLIYTYVLQPAGSTERCAHYLSKKSVPHQIAHSILEAIWGDPLVYLKKNPEILDAINLTRRLRHQSVMQIWSIQSDRDVWSASFGRIHPCVDRDGGSLASPNVNRTVGGLRGQARVLTLIPLTNFSWVYSNHEPCAYGGVSPSQPCSTHGRQLNQISPQYSWLEYPLHSIT